MPQASSATWIVRQGVWRGVCIVPFHPEASGVSEAVKTSRSGSISRCMHG